MQELSQEAQIGQECPLQSELLDLFPPLSLFYQFQKQENPIKLAKSEHMIRTKATHQTEMKQN